MALPGIYKIFEDKWGGQTTWLISDTHFGDKELRAGMPGRPTDEELIKKINARVGRKDTLIHLGDVGDIELARQLRGYKVLIMGNHDAGKTIYEEVFDEVYSGPLMIGEKILLSHEPIDVPWAMNIHGHNHTGKKLGPGHLNVCADVIDYDPLNFNQLLKYGLTSKVEDIHRQTIDTATKRARKRGKKIVKNSF
jgi:calcineurin-like phosphoesterase family protein